MIVVLITILIGVFLIYLFISPKKQGNSTSGNNKESSVKSSPALSPKAIQLQTNLGLTTDKPLGVTISINTNNIDTDYQHLETFVQDLLTIVPNNEVYLLIQLVSELDLVPIQAKLLQMVPSFRAMQHQLLFCTKSIGVIAFVRQIKPYLHIEYNVQHYETLLPHVPMLLYHQQTSQTNSESSINSIEPTKKIRVITSIDDLYQTTFI